MAQLTQFYFTTCHCREQVFNVYSIVKYFDLNMNRSSLYSQDVPRSALPFDVLPDAITSIKDAQKGILY